MKNFIKTIFASCLGTILATGIIVAGILIYASIANRQPDQLEKASILTLNLEEVIPEKTGNVQEEQFAFTTAENIGLNTLKKIIRHAAEDKMVKGIFLDSRITMGNQATLFSLRKELKNFKESGKFIYSYADFYSQSAYWIASVADSVFLNPNGYVDIKGYGVAIPFYKAFLDKAGIEMNVFYAGDFKSGPEPFSRNDISENNAIQTKQFLNEMQQVMLNDISEDRKLTIAQLDDIIDNYRGGRATTSLSYGLVDKIAYLHDVEALFRKELDLKENKTIPYVDISTYKDYLPFTKDYSSKNKIAVIYAEGEILYHSKSKGVISEKYIDILNDLAEDKQLKAIVLRINSPGGNSLTSDNIAQRIKRFKEETNIPVVASFGDYAASGGYYISAYADTIVTLPNTLTGSIGVYVLMPNAEELLHDKIGIQFDTLKTDPWAVSFTPYYDLDNKESKHMQEFTDDLYLQFLKVVAEGRNMEVDEVDKIASGRVWTGMRAVENGLADELGELEDAITIAAEMANVDDYYLSEYPKIKENPWKKIIESLFPEDSEANINLKVELPFNKEIQYLQKIMEQKDPQARLPWLFRWD